MSHLKMTKSQRQRTDSWLPGVSGRGSVRCDERKGELGGGARAMCLGGGDDHTDLQVR